MTVNINCSNWEETQMAGPKLSEESILAFRDNLILEEKSISGMSVLFFALLGKNL